MSVTVEVPENQQELSSMNKQEFEGKHGVEKDLRQIERNHGVKKDVFSGSTKPYYDDITWAIEIFRSKTFLWGSGIAAFVVAALLICSMEFDNVPLSVKDDEAFMLYIYACANIFVFIRMWSLNLPFLSLLLGLFKGSRSISEDIERRTWDDNNVSPNSSSEDSKGPPETAGWAFCGMLYIYCGVESWPLEYGNLVELGFDLLLILTGIIGGWLMFIRILSVQYNKYIRFRSGRQKNNIQVPTEEKV